MSNIHQIHNDKNEFAKFISMQGVPGANPSNLDPNDIHLLKNKTPQEVAVWFMRKGQTNPLFWFNVGMFMERWRCEQKFQQNKIMSSILHKENLIPKDKPPLSKTRSFPKLDDEERQRRCEERLDALRKRGVCV